MISRYHKYTIMSRSPAYLSMNWSTDVCDNPTTVGGMNPRGDFRVTVYA